MSFPPRFPSLVLAAAASLACVAGVAAQTPTAPPPAPGAAAAPATTIAIPATPPSPLASITPAPAGRRGRATASPAPSPGASPSETPAPPQFSSLDGTWEVELQTRLKTYYSHLALKQSGQGGADVSGVWDRDRQKLPLTGTFDGRLFKFVIKDSATAAAAREYTMSGYVENFSDIVGIMNDGTKSMPFTAQHRKREKGIDVGPGLGLPPTQPR